MISRIKSDTCFNHMEPTMEPLFLVGLVSLEAVGVSVPGDGLHWSLDVTGVVGAIDDSIVITWFLWCYHLQLKKWTLTQLLSTYHISIHSAVPCPVLRHSHVNVLACTSLNRQVSTHILAGAERVRALSINLLPALSYYGVIHWDWEYHLRTKLHQPCYIITRGWLLPCQRHG